MQVHSACHVELKHAPGREQEREALPTSLGSARIGSLLYNIPLKATDSKSPLQSDLGKL